MRRQKLIGIALVLSLACLSPAPMRDLRSGVKVQPEKNQQQVEIDQRNYQQVQGETAQAPRDTEDMLTDNIDSERSASKTVKTFDDDQKASANTDKTLAEATAGIGRKDPRGVSWIWGMLFLILGFGVVLALRQFANKSIPEMPNNLRTGKW